MNPLIHASHWDTTGLKSWLIATDAKTAETNRTKSLMGYLPNLRLAHRFLIDVGENITK